MPTKTQDQLEEKIEVQITDTGVVMDKDVINSKQWQEFAKGKHTASINVDRIIIRKE